jgi:hypothetical protein
MRRTIAIAFCLSVSGATVAIAKPKKPALAMVCGKDCVAGLDEADLVTLQPKKVASMGIQVASSDARLTEDTLDFGARRATLWSDSCGPTFIDEVNQDGDSDSLETILKNVEENPLGDKPKEWKKKEIGKDGTFRLVHTYASATKDGKEEWEVYYRVKAGAKLYTCGSRGLSPSCAARLQSICESIAAAK